MEIIYIWVENYRNLKGGFTLSNKYSIEKENNSFTVTKNNSAASNFFTNNNDIQISAVVGKNGDGKSNLLRKALEILHNHEKSRNEILIYEIEGELLFIGDQYSKVTFDNKLVKRRKEDFFTIYFNYMLDSLWGSNEDDWINDIYHRSDKYTTPILIEPQKKDDNVDMKNIDYLNKQRIIAHSEYNKNSRLCDIFNPTKATLTINIEKIKKILNKANKGPCLTLVLSKNKDVYNETLQLTRYSYTKDGLKNQTSKEASRNIAKPIVYSFEKSKSKSTLTNKINFESTTRKLENSIKRRSPIEFLTSKKRRLAIANAKLWNIPPSYLNLLYLADKIDKYNNKNDKHIEYSYNEDGFITINPIQDISHNTLKIRNSINYQEVLKNTKNQINLATLKRKLKLTISLEDDLFKCIPSWFNIELIDSKGVKFSSLSSGQKSLYTLLSTIKYHVNNIQSYNTATSIKYSDIVLLMDEVDVGLHPEWQRDFVNDLLLFLEDINRTSKPIRFKFHVILTSHSPFVISDIPNERVTYLEKGVQSNLVQHSQTFGENIHTLLTDTFFMKDGLLMGSFAQRKIQ
ncbi:AAA family ATPase [Vibrio sp. 10N.261.54.A5]|uniref:AAA family ATPase n=1 Tax=Vibrio sp. 10N.261.54.A5 TaxID=3229686 RepID=UPI003550F5C6